jgi:hypothetical protein
VAAALAPPAQGARAERERARDRAGDIASLCVLWETEGETEREITPLFNTQAHYILDEMVMNGCVVETNRVKILTPVQLLDKIEAIS